MTEENLDPDGVQAFENAEFSNTVNQMLEQEKAYIKQIKLFARLRAKKYVALIEEGFSSEQAIYIIEKTPLLG